MGVLFDSAGFAQQTQDTSKASPPSSPETQQGTEAPLTAAAEKADQAAEQPFTEPLTATVTEVSGNVERAKPGVSPLAAEGWTPVKWKDRLDSGTQIRTGLRSYVHLQFGTTTMVAIRSATHASVDQIYRSANTEHVQLGLGYGTVRGGSVEGTVRSQVVVDSPVATLAKRGTEGWEMHVEPMTGRFRVSLAEYGIVEAVKKLRDVRRVSRSVRPGEYVTDANIANMWIKQDIFDRNIQFYQADAVTAADAEFSTENTRGYAVLAPGGGSELTSASGRVSADFVTEQLEERYGETGPTTTVVVPGTRVSRPEGNFGTGQTFKVLVPKTAAGRSAASSAKPPVVLRR